MIVSCLMVTQPLAARLAHVQKSVAGYLAQTYRARELIVVIDPSSGTPPDTLLAYLAALNRPDIRVVTVPRPATLGRLRNVAREHAGGEIICQWDDDDLYHPMRLETQMAALLAGDHEAVLLADVLQYVPARGAMYWTNWRATPAGGHPGTLMARRAAPIRYPEIGEAAARGEDLAVALALRRRGGLGHLAGQAHLFIYVSHGANTWSAAHHEMLISSLAISQALLRRREAGLRASLAPFALPPGQVEFFGVNGAAFTL